MCLASSIVFMRFEVTYFLNKKRGRPPKEGSKHNRIFTRIGEKDGAMLEYLVSRTGLSMSDIIRNGIRIQYNMQKHKD